MRPIHRAQLSLAIAEIRMRRRALGTAKTELTEFEKLKHQKEHGNDLLRLRRDDRRIPTTKWHRAMNAIFSTGKIAGGFALLLRW